MDLIMSAKKKHKCMILKLKMKMKMKVYRQDYMNECKKCNRIKISTKYGENTGIVYPKKIKGRTGFYISGDLQTISHNDTYACYFPKFKIIDSDILKELDIDDKHDNYCKGIGYCKDCIIKWIEEEKIIFETCMKECYKCGSPFKNYNELRNRFIVFAHHTKRFVAYDNRKMDIAYALNQDEVLIKSMIKSFIDNLSIEQVNYYGNYFKEDGKNYILWICKTCLYDIGFPREIKMYLYGDDLDIHHNLGKTSAPSIDDNSDILSVSSIHNNSGILSTSNASTKELVSPRLPMCICTIIGEYLTPSYLVNKCKICESNYYDHEESPNFLINVGFVDCFKYSKKVDINLTKDVKDSNNKLDEGDDSKEDDSNNLDGMMDGNKNENIKRFKVIGIKSGNPYPTYPLDILFDNKHPQAHIVKPQEDKGFICLQCVKKLLDMKIFYHNPWGKMPKWKSLKY